MDGGPFPPMQSNKRSFGVMATSPFRDYTPTSDTALQDEHDDEERQFRRRRLNSARPPRLHSTVDEHDFDFEFRRPEMSTSANAGAASMEGSSSRPVVIDLTDEAEADTSQETDRLSAPFGRRIGREMALARLSRGPRWDRELLNSPPPGEADIALQGAPRQLALPAPGRRYPQYSSLRRPAPRPSPPIEMDEDDVELLASMTASHRQGRSRSRRSTPVQRGSTAPRATSQNEPIDLTQDDDDDVVHLDTRQREDLVNNDLPIPTRTVSTTTGSGLGGLASIIPNIVREHGVGGRLLQRLAAGFQGQAQAHQDLLDHYQQHHAGHHHHHHHHHHHGLAGQPARYRGSRAPAGPVGNLGGLLHMGGPGAMNFGATGFDMGIIGGGYREPTPKYEPPDDVGPGFTRSPGESEEVVCPNCGDELAMGDSETKQELWAIKTCGHVYCGECARNRGGNKGKKGKGKAPAADDPFLPSPFKTCMVKGCDKSASAKSMVLVYLGS